MANGVKVYVVQQFGRGGRAGDVLALKLTRQAAHNVAKAHAPAQVIFAVADKDSQTNLVQTIDQRIRS
jgi:hypothetical protein